MRSATSSTTSGPSATTVTVLGVAEATTTTTTSRALPATTQPPADDRLFLPHWNKGDSHTALEVAASGITGDPSRGCVWITYGDVAHAAIWPPGTYALFNPLRVFNEASDVIWAEGEAHHFGGSADAAGDTSMIPSQCRNANPVAVVASMLEHR